MKHAFRILGAFVLLGAFSSVSQAIEFKIRGEQLRLGIIESLYSSYHGDLGYLVTEHDRFGRATNARFYDIVNRLNVDLSWRRFRLFTRFDTAIFFDTPAGSCGPDATTPPVIRSRFCQQYFYLEKIALEYSGRIYEGTVGDFYVSFGRGLVLSVRKLDELGIDTSIGGVKFVYHEDNLAATLFTGVPLIIWGGGNIQNVDQATGRYAPDPHDIIAGGRVEYRIRDKVILGVHEVGGIQWKNSTSTSRSRDGMLMYGMSLEVPRIGRWGSIYVEGAGQMVNVSDRKQHGYALYGAFTGYFGPTSLLLEIKHYSEFQRWRSSVDPTLVEFLPVAYNQPPTAERIITELTAPLYDVSGPRLRFDWRVHPKVVLYASYGFFQERGLSSGHMYYHDLYGGAEIRWNESRSHFFPSGGYRTERCSANAQLCIDTSPAGGEFQRIGHVEWDLSQAFSHGLSLETHGFALFRKGDLVSVNNPDGSVGYPEWTEGDAYFSLKWTPHLLGTFGYEWSTRPSGKVNEHYFNGAIQWNITTASSIRFFVGGTRGGLKCISGVCRDFPPFTGARLEVVVRL